MKDLLLYECAGCNSLYALSLVSAKKECKKCKSPLPTIKERLKLAKRVKEKYL